MDTKKIAALIKKQRKKKNLTQEELASRLFVTEKAVSRWETGRGTPDISLLIPLSKELDITPSELLSGEKNNNDLNTFVEYTQSNRKEKYNLSFKLTIIAYITSIIIFIIYLKLDFNPNIEINYFIRLALILISSVLVILGSYIYNNYCIEKINDKQKIKKLSTFIIFIYYFILIFNMTIFARFANVNSYNLIPFKSIYEIITQKNLYSIIINIFGNFLIFMPLEYFLIEIFNITKRKKALFISTIIIILFEIIQYISKKGVFDIDDIILCTSGMMLFYELYIKYLKSKQNN